MILTIAEVAADLKVRRETVYKIIRLGKLRAFKVGNRYRIQSEDLAAYKEDAIETVRAN